jgi:hypothetical protein
VAHEEFVLEEGTEAGEAVSVQGPEVEGAWAEVLAHDHGLVSQAEGHGESAGQGIAVGAGGRPEEVEVLHVLLAATKGD